MQALDSARHCRDSAVDNLQQNRKSRLATSADGTGIGGSGLPIPAASVSSLPRPRILAAGMGAGQDEEAVDADQPSDVYGALDGGPSDPLAPPPQLESGRAEAAEDAVQN